MCVLVRERSVKVESREGEARERLKEREVYASEEVSGDCVCVRVTQRLGGLMHVLPLVIHICTTSTYR